MSGLPPSSSPPLCQSEIRLLLDFLRQDDRPSFLLEVDSIHSEHSHVNYMNPALLSLLDGSVHDLPAGEKHAGFRLWATSKELLQALDSDNRTNAVFAGRIWHCYFLNSRWRVVSSSQASTAYYYPPHRHHHHAHDQQHPDSGAAPPPNNAYIQIQQLAMPSHRPPSPELSPGLRRSSGSQTAPHLKPNSLLGRRYSTGSPNANPRKRSCAIGKDSFSSQDEVAKFKSAKIDWIKDGRIPHNKFAKFIRSFDWASTAFGPISSWSFQLRQIVIMLLAAPEPRMLFWGSKMTLLYNEAYIPLIRSKHPFALGRNASEEILENWDKIKTILELARYEGKMTRLHIIPVWLKRPGTSFGPEETYFSLTTVPIPAPDGSLIGIVIEASEVTGEIISDRRSLSLIEVGEQAAKANSIQELWVNVVDALGKNSRDVPFALVYSVDQGNARSSPSDEPAPAKLPQLCHLEGVIGLPADHADLIKSFDMTDPSIPLAAVFRQAGQLPRGIVVEAVDGSISEYMESPISSARIFRGFCVSAAVCAVRLLTGSEIYGFLVLGLNPRRPYDAEYETFLRLMIDKVVQSAAIHSIDTERRQVFTETEALEVKNTAICEELRRRAAAAEKSEHGFSKLARSAPVGCIMVDPNGSIRWLNDAYFELTGIPKDFSQQHLWESTIFPEDLPLTRNIWNQMMSGNLVEPFEYRVRCPRDPNKAGDLSASLGYRWILCNISMDKNAEGLPEAIYGWIVDITHQKYAEQLQAQRLQDALEHKRQSENFIDMTSHEMRNPLSAIIQSADSILDSIKSTPCAVPGPGRLECANELRDTVIDAANTILLCAQHQKRIVDDILTLSKLDSSLLIITPDKASPHALVKRALRMYEAELLDADISTTIKIDKSYKTMMITEVILDPIRCLQVVINLLTNAIKVSRKEERRVITIELFAYQAPPDEGPNGVVYIPSQRAKEERLLGPEWGRGGDLYIQFSVTDTGPGLSEDDLNRIFLKFSKRSPKTYTNYGGSGLGLFVSRELSELQGGQIGVSSKPGHGSTFAFYVKARYPSPDIPTTNTESKSIPSRPKGPSLLASRKMTTYGFSTAQRPQSPLVALGSNNDLIHILIVEDNFVNQRVMSQQLKRAGCRVHVSSNGQEALDLLKRSTFATHNCPSPENNNIPNSSLADGGLIQLSLLLMDLEMPVMDGLTCVTKIREMEKIGHLRGHVPVIAITANARTEQINSAITRGMDLVVTKPFRIPELLPQMRRLIEQTCLQRDKFL